MLDNFQRKIIPIQNLNINFLKKHVIPIGINWINGSFNLNNSVKMYLDIALKHDNSVRYSLEKCENYEWTTLEEKEIPLSQVTRIIKSFYNKGNSIPNSDLEISFDEQTENNWGDKKWFVIYGDSVKPKLNSHSYKAPAKKCKFVCPEKMF